MAERDNLLTADTATVCWILLANAWRARLLRCGSTEDGRCRVEERGSIDNAWPKHNHCRSGPLWKNATITFGMEDNDGEEVRRFAKDVTAWVEQRIEELGIGSMHILASGRFLGALRKVRSLWLPKHRGSERKADLMHLSPGKLAKHPLIHRLIASASSATHEDR